MKEITKGLIPNLEGHQRLQVLDPLVVIHPRHKLQQNLCHKRIKNSKFGKQIVNLSFFRIFSILNTEAILQLDG